MVPLSDWVRSVCRLCSVCVLFQIVFVANRTALLEFVLRNQYGTVVIPLLLSFVVFLAAA